MEQEKTKVSVIVPVYNMGTYLEQCLESLKNQTLSEIEVICVNDGSTDASPQIIEQFVAQDHRFCAIHKKNTGYGHSVNLGIQAAKSPYIGIVESDDFAEPDMFLKLYDAALKSKADLVKANYNEYYGNTTTPARLEKSLGDFPYEQIFSPKDYHKIFGLHPSIWTSLYRKSFLEAYDIQFSETPGASYQDIAFAFKVYASARSVYLLRDALLNYRVDNVDSSIHNPQKIFCVCEELSEITRYIEAQAATGVIEEAWKEELSAIASWIKYRNYMWNYSRLSLAYQYMFLVKVQDELREVLQDSTKSDVWTDREKENLRQMAENPDVFFKMTSKEYEDPRMNLLPILNHTFSVRCFMELVMEAHEIVIYGGGRIGKCVWNCLRKIDAEHKVTGFIVSRQGNNDRWIDGKKVFLFSEIVKRDGRDQLIIVAMQKSLQYDVVLKLKSEGYGKILLIDEKMKSWIYENT